MMTAQKGWFTRRKLFTGVGLMILCCAIGIFLINRSISNIDLSGITVYKEGVGPSYQETLVGGAD